MDGHCDDFARHCNDESTTKAIPQKRIMKLNLPDAEIEYWADFFSKAEADALFQRLMKETPWQQDDVKIFGKVYPQPRLTAFYADGDKTLSYSGLTMKSHSWTETLAGIRNRVEAASKSKFNSVLLNLYRDGRDSNGWHADNESYLGKNPVIASVTFGEARPFQMKHSSLPIPTKKLLLEHGSLLVMGGEMQHFWKHQIPKTSKAVAPRINLTFRFVY